MKDEFLERLKVHKVRNAKLSQELGTYKRGFIDQTKLIQKLQQENKELKQENEILKNKPFETHKTDSLKSIHRNDLNG